MGYLREGICLRAMAQRDPLVEDQCGGRRLGRPGSADTFLVTRLVVVDAVLLALVLAYVAWASRTNRGSHVSSFSGPRPAGRARWVRANVTGAVAGGVVLGSAGHGLGTRLLNILVFFALMAAVYAGGAAPHNRALDRR